MNMGYILHLREPFASGWSKARLESLPSALSAAWRKHKRDCSIGNITHQQKVVLNNQELMQAIAEMNSLLQDHPKLPLNEIAEQAIQKMAHSEVLS